MTSTAAASFVKTAEQMTAAANTSGRRSSKHQAPNPKEAPSTKLQERLRTTLLGFGIGSLGFGASGAYGVAAGDAAGVLPNVGKFTVGAFSAPVVAVKNGRGLKPNILFNMFVWKRSSAVLYSCTAVLKLFRSTEIRFSVPSSCACKF